LLAAIRLTPSTLEKAQHLRGYGLHEFSGNASSTKRTEVSAMRRPVQLGQNPRPLHEKVRGPAFTAIVAA
jgi:hypothetical protein